jgi:hypothetical protein
MSGAPALRIDPAQRVGGAHAHMRVRICECVEQGRDGGAALKADTRERSYGLTSEGGPGIGQAIGQSWDGLGRIESQEAQPISSL